MVFWNLDGEIEVLAVFNGACENLDISSRSTVGAQVCVALVIPHR